MILGLFLVLLGIVFFLKNLGIIVLPNSFWSFMWPLLLIVIGIYMAMAAHRGRQYKHWLFNRGWKRNDSDVQ
jgi:uncharacterized integral membrane protein